MKKKKWENDCSTLEKQTGTSVCQMFRSNTVNFIF